jgi:hypothetical protein
MVDVTKYLENFDLDQQKSLFDNKPKTRVKYYICR